jgi:hypothetical protein
MSGGEAIMGQVQFPVPEDLQETIRLLNAPYLWNLRLEEHDGCFYLLTGDQVFFSAETKREVEAFLAGCFAAAYQGKSLAQITAEVEEGAYTPDDYEENLRILARE